MPEYALPLLQWYESMRVASERFGKPIACPDNIETLMAQCGFVDTSHRTIRVSLKPRRKDERDHKLSWSLRLPMTVAYDEGSRGNTDGHRLFESMSMSLFTRELQMSRVDVENWCERLRQITATKVPVYFNL